MEETQKHSGSLTIEHVSNGYILTTGIGGRSVAANEGDALKEPSEDIEEALPNNEPAEAVKAPEPAPIEATEPEAAAPAVFSLADIPDAKLAEELRARGWHLTATKEVNVMVKKTIKI